MIIDFWNRNGGSPTPTDLSGVVASADLSGTTLNLDNPSGTTIDTVDFSGIVPDLTNYYTKTEADAKFPESTNIRHIIAISQANYDLISNPSSDTLYVINS